MDSSRYSVATATITSDSDSDISDDVSDMGESFVSSSAKFSKSGNSIGKSIDQSKKSLSSGPFRFRKVPLVQHVPGDKEGNDQAIEAFRNPATVTIRRFGQRIRAAKLASDHKTPMVEKVKQNTCNTMDNAASRKFGVDVRKVVSSSIEDFSFESNHTIGRVPMPPSSEVLDQASKASCHKESILSSKLYREKQASTEINSTKFQTPMTRSMTVELEESEPTIKVQIENSGRGSSLYSTACGVSTTILAFAYTTKEEENTSSLNNIGPDHRAEKDKKHIVHVRKFFRRQLSLSETPKHQKVKANATSWKGPKRQLQRQMSRKLRQGFKQRIKDHNYFVLEKNAKKAKDSCLNELLGHTDQMKKALQNKQKCLDELTRNIQAFERSMANKQLLLDQVAGDRSKTYLNDAIHAAKTMIKARKHKVDCLAALEVRFEQDREDYAKQLVKLIENEEQEDLLHNELVDNVLDSEFFSWLDMLGLHWVDDIVADDLDEVEAENIIIR